MAQLKIDLIVDNKGSVQIQKFGLDAQGQISKLSNSLGGLNKQFLGLGGNVKSAFAGLGSAYALRELINISDAYTNLESRLRLVSKSEEDLLRTETALYGIAQQTRGAYEGTVDLYTRLARATKDLEISQTDLLAVTKGIGEALVVSGASAASADAALMQLGQGLASGTLRGEELNSILEQTPRVAAMIADGLGIGIGQLKKFGAEGKLTSETVLKALLSQTENVNAEFSRMETTVGQAGTVVLNTFKGLVDSANEGSGATKGISSSILGLSQTIDQNRDEILSLFQGIVTGAEWSTERITNMIRSVKGAAAVAAGALDLTDFVTMNPQELKRWMSDFDNGTASIRTRLKEAKAELAGLKDSDFGVAPKMASLNKQVRDLEAQLKAAESAQTILNESAKNFSTTIDKGAGATLNLSGASKTASSTARVHREELRQTVAEARNLVSSYKDSTSALNDWSRTANSARSDMLSLNFDFGPGDGEVSRLLADRNKTFSEGVSSINNYNMALAESEQVVSRARGEYTRAQADFAAMQRELAGNPLLSDAERGNRLAPFADALREKAEGTRKALAEQLKLNELNASGVLTEEKLRHSLFETGTAMHELTAARMRDLESSNSYFDNMQAGLMRVSDASSQAGASIADAISSGFDSATNAIADFAVTGKMTFSSFADAIISDLARIAVQQTITGPLAAGISSALGGGLSSLFSFSAKGNVYDSPSLSSYSNSVYSSPQMFAFASGAGIFAEAGPEAIMPLTRTSGGDLGVRAVGGSSVVVNVIESSSKAGTQQRSNKNGVDVIDVFVEKIKSSLASDVARGAGVFPDAMESTYNLSRAAGRY